MSSISYQGYVSDNAFNQEILALDVKCKNNEWGCKWEGEFQKYQVNRKNDFCINNNPFHSPKKS